MLEILGLIKPIDQNGNPKYYKPTYISPVTKWRSGKSFTPVISHSAKQIGRRVGSPIKTVRDHKTGRFKGRRDGRGEGFKRDYDTIVSQDGKRIPVLRVHKLAYTCSILREPTENVPWVEKDGPNGMRQWVLHHRFPNKKTEIDELRELDVTFVRQKTGTYDELVIYMPEKYLFEHELGVTKKIMDDYVWVARKWFQNRFKTWLGLALPYSPMEIARELVEPGMRRFVQEHGMAKVKTRYGAVMIDESKRGFPEKEYSSIEEMEVDLHASDRILALEQMLSRMVETQQHLMESIDKMAISQENFTKSIEKLIGAGSKKDGERMKENMERGIF